MVAGFSLRAPCRGWWSPGAAPCSVSRLTGLPFGKNSCFICLGKMLPPPRYPDTQPWHPPRAVSTPNCGRRQQRGCCPHWGLQDGTGHPRALTSCFDPGASLTLPQVPFLSQRASPHILLVKVLWGWGGAWQDPLCCSVHLPGHLDVTAANLCSPGICREIVIALFLD